jgi:hypothetical protein
VEDRALHGPGCCTAPGCWWGPLGASVLACRGQAGLLGSDKCLSPTKGVVRTPPPPPLFARARLARFYSKTHATEQGACDGQGRAQDARLDDLDVVAATKAEETPHTKGGS